VLDTDGLIQPRASFPGGALGVQVLANYLFSFNDYRMMAKAVHAKSPVRNRILMVASLAMLLIVAADILTDKSTVAKLSNPLAIFLEFFPLLVIFMIFAIAWRLSLFERFGYKRCMLADKQVSYSIGDKGVSWTTEDQSGTINWSAVSSAIVNPEAIVLIVGKHSGVTLPKRAFVSPSEFETAASFVRAQLSA
jgi:hypothetical protein